ncbi:MAG TPA: FHA domain-containing protein [Anaerolineaceae bacterium]|nr:FHA domain-containing protein [Anaerolineaceae bacterium]
MSAIIVLILRVILALALYSFLAWALYTIWRELRAQSLLVSTQRIAPITVNWNSNEQVLTHQFTNPEIIIGRDSSCELAVTDEMVSARHARLSYHHNQWWVEDLQSTNGTYLNDERVFTATVLIEGDELRCGKLYFQINFSGKPSDKNS